MAKEYEWQTRKERIDTRLKSLPTPWIIQPFSPGMDLKKLNGVVLTEYPTQNGPADYVFVVKGKILGILEAKKLYTGPQNVMEQAKRYSCGLEEKAGNWKSFHVPFLYSSNGEKIWFADIREEKYYEREIADFHTADALEELFGKNAASAKKWFKDTPIEVEKLRPYQKEAVEAAERGICEDRRRMMLAMATGTGKTFTTVVLVYRLIKSGFIRRVLFLVDRRALAAQAAQAFSSFTTPSGNKFNQEYEVFSQRFQKEDFGEGEKYDIGVLPNAYLTHANSTHTFVFVATIQRLAINLFGREDSFRQGVDDPDIDEEAGKLPIPIHAFDLVIADECHRGYTSQDTNIWRSVLNHFDAVKIGLTATPAAHTVAYFNKPIYRYNVEQAVLDGFLVDYQAVKIKSNVRINGIFLKKGEEVGLKNTETGRETIDKLEDEREFNSTEIERKITSPDSNRKIIEEIAGYAREHLETTGHFPKTLIFAVNDLPHTSHADQIVNIAREVFREGDDFVQKITGNPTVDRPLEKIRRFRNRPMPMIVVTVDMLSTGVDIPALEFIVMLRPVKSRILWTQMLGRGTRRCPDINKEFFTVFDCFDGTLIEYFKNSTDFSIEIEEQGEILGIEEIIENIWNNIEPDYNANRLIRRLRRIAETMSGKARADFSVYIPDGDMSRFAYELKKNLRDNFSKTMKLLRNKDFQNLLVNYDRTRTPFYVAYSTEDTVSSEYVFRVGDKRLKPAEYLEAFTRFIQANKQKIEALKILFNSPKKWNGRVLNEIRTELKRNHFDEENLSKAHQLTGYKAIADIISIIKKAENSKNPLMTAEERVSHTIGELEKEHHFSDEQKEWLKYIKQHLIINLAIEEENFKIVPALERHGGLTAAGRIFGETLVKLITEINEKIAS